MFHVFSQSRFRITDKQKEKLVDIVESKFDILFRKAPRRSGRACIVETWQTLADELNAMGGGIKTASDWKLSFAEQRQRIKKKLNKIRQPCTGAALSIDLELTPLERRVANLCYPNLMKIKDECGLELDQLVKREASCSPTSSTSWVDMDGRGPELDPLCMRQAAKSPTSSTTNDWHPPAYSPLATISSPNEIENKLDRLITLAEESADRQLQVIQLLEIIARK